MNDGVWFKNMFPYQTEVIKHIRYFHEEKRKRPKVHVKAIVSLLLFFLLALFYMLVLSHLVISLVITPAVNM